MKKGIDLKKTEGKVDILLFILSGVVIVIVISVMMHMTFTLYESFAMLIRWLL